jgi:transcriptional regulator with XRE-family HTH domain
MVTGEQGEQKESPQRRAQINHFRARLEIETKRRGLRFTDVARELGVSIQALMAAMNQGRPNRNMITEKRLCEILGITSEELLEPVDEIEYGAETIPRFPQ